MNLRDKIKQKLPGGSSYYNQKAIIFRNRGDSYAVQILDAVRIKYTEKPNIHELSTGEEIPAVPKDYVLNMYGSGSCFFAVEGRDDQLVVFRPEFSLQDSDMEEFNPANLDIDLDTDLEGEEIKDRLIDKNMSAVNFAVLDSRDERFTFLSEELMTSQNKYGIGGLLQENMDIVLTVTTAIAVTIIIYTVGGDMVPALESFGEQLGTLNSNIVELQNSLNSTQAPPGQ